MNERSSCISTRPGWGRAVIAISLAAALPTTAWGADRMVLAEEFTNTG